MEAVQARQPVTNPPSWRLPTRKIRVDRKYDAVKEFRLGRFISYQELVAVPGVDITTPNYRFRYETDSEHNQLVVSRLKKSTSGVRYGWKFHISLADETPANLARAWRCLIPIIKKYRVNVFKVILPREGAAPETDPKLQGRTMTLYACKEVLTLTQWQKLLGEITRKLQQQDIQAGPRSTICQPIGDNPYLSYRNETLNGEYLPARRASSYNPDGLHDPFDGMIVQEVHSKCPCPFTR